ncbi:MAG: polymer-forming cytoskeletal protein [Deltaproteobacteria bacterium]|nr:MAG: polymer-forming cytoskeletal protein [Deltaproteobacteria bacterium]
MLKNKPKEFSIIDRELTVDGKVSTNGRLIIKGIVKGTLVGNHVIIAEEGAVYADAKVASITIGGIFEGEVKASKELIILPTGRCKGKIICKNFVIEPGGILEAHVTCIAPKDSNSEKDLLTSEKDK